MEEKGVFSGENVEKAIAAGLTTLGLTREQVEVEIMDEGSRGFLGIGSRPACVKLLPVRPSPPTPVAPSPPAQPEGPDPAQVAQEVLAELLKRMGLAADIHVRQEQPASDEEEGPLVLDVRGDGVDALIGRRGETLAGLQRIVRLIVGRRLQYRANLVVDVKGFKKRREQNLRRLAEQMAKQALEENQTVTLEPMPAYERRIVHLTLRDRTDVRTESVGTGYRRRVTIIPRSGERS